MDHSSLLLTLTRKISVDHVPIYISYCFSLLQVNKYRAMGGRFYLAHGLRDIVPYEEERMTAGLRDS